MKRALPLAAVLAVSTACSHHRPASAPSNEGALRPPVADEAHGMRGADREAALLVQRSHYQNVLDAYGPLVLEGVDWKDPKKPARCEITVTLPETGYREGSFVDGLPVRRAQPVVFNRFQQQVVEGLTRCGSEMAFTSRTWTGLQDSARALVLKNSGTTFCLKDEDCYGVEILDPCGGRPAQKVFGSDSTDPVFFIAYRKFMPVLLVNVAQQAHGAAARLGKTHPDHGAPRGCPMRHWEERPLEAACVRNSCRAKTP
ncbi:MAG: hypothetical protein M0D55_12860 [Elusimicrobiota bacterium]|nr:MAG: hypothetical protein M0D55_12860 [Elusimicrobiota bacterium]